MLRLNTRIGGSDSTPTTAFAGPRRCRFRTKAAARAPAPVRTRAGCPDRPARRQAQPIDVIAGSPKRSPALHRSQRESAHGRSPKS